MRKIITLASALLFSAAALQAQTVATFDTLSLTGTDTFYVNYTSWGNDVGFNDGLAYFPCVYDSTQWGVSWSSGFVYTNSTDLSDSSYNNLHASVTGKGYNNSNQYLSVSAFSPVKIHLKGKAQGQPVRGFYATNLVYGYKEMSTDGFSKKFGDSANKVGATDFPDWFKITVKGYENGNLKSDSVDFYLADFRDPDNSKDYILHTWEWVDLLPLGEVDSLMISLSSTDTAGGWGMNNPAYFAMDNFETLETNSVGTLATSYVAKIYPNPASDKLFIEAGVAAINKITVMSMTGKVVKAVVASESLTLVDVSQLASGVYIVHIEGDNGSASTRFVKK